jgi:hypothetical protein
LLLLAVVVLAAVTAVVAVAVLATKTTIPLHLAAHIRWLLGLLVLEVILVKTHIL